MFSPFATDLIETESECGKCLEEKINKERYVRRQSKWFLLCCSATHQLDIVFARHQFHSGRDRV